MTDQITIRWHRAGERCIQWTVTDQYGDENIYHCNGYAAFHGPASGAHYLARQVSGWASSPWHAEDREVSKRLRREYRARSVRKGGVVQMTYVVICTPNLYGQEARPYLARDERGRGQIFDSRAEAKAFVVDCQSDPVILGHNEAGPPALRIATLAGLPRYLHNQL